MSDSLVTIAELAFGVEAEVMRGFLHSRGVDVFLIDENMSRIAAHLTPMTGRIKLQVRFQDAEFARELLAQVTSDRTPR